VKNKIAFRRIEQVNDPAFAGFATVYREAFGGAPYFEEYTDDGIRQDVWTPHIPECVIVAETSQVVGLACCHAVLAPTEPSIRAFLLTQELPFDPREGIYMSELAVLMEERQKGLGEALIQARFRWAKERGFRFYLLRTAASGSNSQRLYERLGAKRTTFTQDVSLDGIVTSSTQRIFLWGEIP
jgi:ribosomal protein S18 acetylase RimI-like enzyme